ncbi:AAA family ATPase [uncultured Psychrosphaera sp.]|uniref:AAA family ATPase n=1 Tax=uncultured Psychrosphaera sp. TaxID=1403522 RepID=UPI00261EABFC|nr:AAA family ATPase [uncultured Psychrosphaera sp.]
MTLVNTETEQFYIPASRHAFIKKVQAGLTHSKIVAIEGCQGIGKTILIEEVLTLTSPNGNKCYLTAARSINDIQIRSRIIEQLFGNILFDPEVPLLTSFIEFNNNSEMLIAIDNAHYLSGKIIGELLQLFSEANNLGIQLKLVMTFDKTIASTLMNVKSNFLVILPVPLLTKQESYQLLAQYVIDIPAQTNNRIKRWIENSAGLPIQLLAYKDAGDSSSEGEPFNIKLWVSILVTSSLLLALGIYLYRMGIIANQQVSPTNTSNVVKPWHNVTESNAALTQNGSGNNKTSTEVVVPEKEMAQIVISRTASSEQIFSELMNEKPAVGNQKVEKNPTTDLILAELTKQKGTKEKETQLNAEDVALKDSTSKASTEQNSTVNSKVKNPTPQDEPIDMDFFLYPEGEQATKEQAVKNKELAKIDAEPTLDQLMKEDSALVEQQKAKENPYNINNEEFFSLPAELFVLQLTAVSSEPVLGQYLESISYDRKKIRIYKIRRNNNDWLVVTYGLFDTIDEARKTAASIAPNAWAKSISVIQQQILAFDHAKPK